MTEGNDRLTLEIKDEKEVRSDWKMLSGKYNISFRPGKYEFLLRHLHGDVE